MLSVLSFIKSFFHPAPKKEEEVPKKPTTPLPLEYLSDGETVRVHTRSGKYFFDFEPVISTMYKPYNAVAVYLVYLDGTKAFKATVAGCYRKHHGITRKTGIAVLWARNALYRWDMKNTTYISKLICGAAKDPETVTMIRLSFLDRGDDCAVDFHLVELTTAWEMDLLK